MPLLSRPRVLIADDSPVARAAVMELLHGAGYRVFDTSDGLQAAEVAFRELPDLVVLDVHMPRMTGYQVCRLLKNDESTRDIPIILLTGQSEGGGRYRGLQTGADAYIPKLQFRDLLLGEVARLIAAGRPTSRAGRKPASMEGQGILERLNVLLDQKLFESSVLNEIAAAASALADYQAVAQRVMDILGGYIDYQAAGFLLDGHDEIEVVAHLRVPCKPAALASLLRRLWQGYEERAGVPLNPAAVKLLRLGEEQDAGARPGRFRAISLQGARAGNSFLVLAGDHRLSLDDEHAKTWAAVTRLAHLVIDNARLYKRVQELATRDGLTQLLNYRALTESLEREFARSLRSNAAISVVMLDIDHFKSINDRYGHPAGDRVLQQLAQRLRQQSRGQDVVGRSGGEEFMMVLPDTHALGATILAERVRLAISSAQMDLGEGRRARVTVSLGVADFPAIGVESADDLVRRADEALYQAKQQGRDRVCTAEHRVV